MPASIRDIVRRELASLGPLAATAQAAAVLGSPVDLDLLSCALGSPALQLLDELEQVAAAGLLREGAGDRLVRWRTGQYSGRIPDLGSRFIARATPPPFHSGLLIDAIRARPVPFCFQSFLPDPLTSPRVFVADVPARWLAR